jgi:hypothetical protein
MKYEEAMLPQGLPLMLIFHASGTPSNPSVSEYCYFHNVNEFRGFNDFAIGTKLA